MVQTQQQLSLQLVQQNANLVISDCNTIISQQQKPLIIDTMHLVFTIAVSPDGKYIASAGYLDNIIKIWDMITGVQVGNGMSGHTKCIIVINYSKCGNYIVSGGWDHTIRQWNIQTQLQIGQTIKHDDYVQGVDYTTDQTYIVSCSLDGTVRVWESKTGYEQVDYLVQSLIQSDVVLGDELGIIMIWNYQIQQSIVLQQDRSGGIHSIKYSVDGKLIVSGGHEMIIKLWDAVLKQQICSYQGHTAPVYSVNFSPDLRRIISGGQDKIARIWDRTTGQQIGDPSKLNVYQDVIRSTSLTLEGEYIILGRLDKSIIIMINPINH